MTASRDKLDVKRRTVLLATLQLIVTPYMEGWERAFADTQDRQSDAGKKPTPSSSEAINLALESASALASLVRPDGRFVYGYVDTVLHPLPGYDLVRHSGCVWALNLAENVGHIGVRLTVPARSAMTWLFENAARPAPQGGVCIANARGRAELGASALALLALVTLPEFGDKDAALAAQLKDYIWTQQEPDGNFAHRRDLGTGEAEPFESRYFTGEALLALLTLGERVQDGDGIERAKRALLTLVARDYGIADQSQWMMYAAALCHKLRPDAALVTYAEMLADNIIANQAYRDSHFSTLIATRTEALVAYLGMRPADALMAADRDRKAWEAIKENLSIQLKDRLPGGAFWRNATSREVRIDFLQHNLVALMGYGELGSRVHE